MFKISEIANFFLKKYPILNQEEWDNCGLFFNQFDQECSNIVIGLDVTHELIEKAIKYKANLIITHHPIHLNDENEISLDKIDLINLLKVNNIAHLCLHTCFDKANDGTSYQILKRLPMIKNITRNSENEYVFDAELNEPVKLIDFINQINFNSFCSQPIIYDETFKNKIISNLSLCAGSGSFFIHSAIFNQNIDCYLCGDIKWHNWLDAHDNQFPLIDINHASEAIFIEYMYELIKKNFNLEAVKVFPSLKLVSKN